MKRENEPMSWQRVALAVSFSLLLATASSIFGQKSSYGVELAADPTAMEPFSEEARNRSVQVKHEVAMESGTKALDTKKKPTYSEHRDALIGLVTRAVEYRDKGNYSSGKPLYEQALQIIMDMLDLDPSDTGKILQSLNFLKSNGQRFPSLEECFEHVLYQRPLPIYVDLERGRPDLLATLFDLAQFYGDNLFQDRAVLIAEKALGGHHPDFVVTMTYLADLYLGVNDYTVAQLLYQRAVAATQIVPGEEDPVLVLALNNMAVTHDLSGDRHRAVPLYARALAVGEHVWSSHDPCLALVLSNLGLAGWKKGDIDGAVHWFSRAEAIREEALSTLLFGFMFHEEQARVLLASQTPELNALVSLHLDSAPHLPQAANLATEALLRRKGRVLDAVASSFDRASRIENQTEIGQSEAQQSRRQLLVQRGDREGTGQRNVDPESIRARQGEFRNLREQERALRDQIRALRMGEGCIRNPENCRVQLEALAKQKEQLEAQWDEFYARWNPAELQRRRAERERRAIVERLEQLEREGKANSAEHRALTKRLERERQEFLQKWRSGVEMEIRRLRAELQEVNTRLSNLWSKGQSNSHEYRQLETRRVELEEWLHYYIEGIATEPRRQINKREQEVPRYHQQVKKTIPAGAALVEFVVYSPFDPRTERPAANSGDARRYAAFVLRPRGDPKWVELGEAATIETNIYDLRHGLGNWESKHVRDVARKLDQQVMRPIRKLLGSARTVFLSPDGELNLVPFGAFVGENGRYLIERYAFTYLTSGRDLLRLQARRDSQQEPVLIADVDYGAPGSCTTTRWTSLPGTTAAVEALKTILPDATLLTGQQATESALKQVKGPRILYVATHGFFGPDQKPEPVTREHCQGDHGRPQQTPTPENPLLRSSLVLAGANQRKSGDDDGELTALETSGLDLWGTKLVVLAACETGVGVVRGAEGVYGLRRALVIAGSESQIISLWKVDDTATKDLMVDYFKRLTAGEGRAAALRQAQLEMLKSQMRKHPYYWAGFIQSGEWSSLEVMPATSRRMGMPPNRSFERTTRKRTAP